MKKIIFLLSSLLLLSFSVQAQTPEKFNYQGIARDNNGAPMATQNLGLQISILDGSSAVYVETHTVTTNDFGLYTLAVGDGTPATGTMGAVDWSTGNKHIKVEIDPNGGTNYTDLGTTELLSVPYAMYAASSGSTGSTADGWALSGNAATATDFIGTTNNEAIRFRVNNQRAGFISLNTSIGRNSLLESSTGTNNTTVGYGSLRDNTSGSYNTAIGASVLYKNTEGERNTAVGTSALTANEIGSNNSAFGSGALYSNLSGKANTALGSAALLKSNAQNNTAVGAYSLNVSTTGNGNTAVGRSSLSRNLEGSYNTSIGNSALNSNITGSYNIGIGARSDVSTDNLINAIAIGSHSFVSQDNSIVLGSIKNINGAAEDTKVGIGTTAPEAMLSIKRNADARNLSLIHNSGSSKWDFSINQTTVGLPGGQITFSSLDLYRNDNMVGSFSNTGEYNSASDSRLKDNITTAQPLLDKVRDIKIRQYVFINDETHQPKIGFIAQELEKQFPEFVSKPSQDSTEDSYYSVNYAGMSAVAIKAIQEQQDIIEAQADELKKVQSQLEAMEARLSKLEK